MASAIIMVIDARRAVRRLCSRESALVMAMYTGTTPSGSTTEKMAEKQPSANAITGGILLQLERIGHHAGPARRGEAQRRGHAADAVGEPVALHELRRLHAHLAHAAGLLHAQ